MTDRQAPATIRDVAERAGVSTATVSRVLAGIGHPRADTVAAVMAAVEALDYRPSIVARSLRMKRTRTLGLIVTDIQNLFFPDLVQGADQEARARGYSILLGSAAYDERRAVHYLDLMVDRRVDGIVVASSQVSSTSGGWLANAPVPVVVANAEPGDLPVTVITSDNQGGARTAVEHLLALGHRRIAYVRGSATYTADAPRLAGFREAVRAAGLAPADTPELQGDGRFEGGDQAVRELFADHARITAIACYNDITAIGAMRALRDLGRRVPDDVSVIGIDDIAPASWVAPALTTVAQQRAEMGRLATDRLIAAIEGTEDPTAARMVRLPMSLTVRESTGPAPR